MTAEGPQVIVERSVAPALSQGGVGAQIRFCNRRRAIQNLTHFLCGRAFPHPIHLIFGQRIPVLSDQSRQRSISS